MVNKIYLCSSIKPVTDGEKVQGRQRTGKYLLGIGSSHVAGVVYLSIQTG
jgi:hypothetical protein